MEEGVYKVERVVQRRKRRVSIIFFREGCVVNIF